METTSKPCPRCRRPNSMGYCPDCHGPLKAERRVVGSCGECGSDVIRLADDEHMASCECGKSSISMKFMDTNRQLSPNREKADAGG